MGIRARKPERVKRQAMPVAISIPWKPVRDPHYVVASLQPAGGGLRQLFVVQTALRAIQCLARGDQPVVGLLLGARFECALTRIPYVLIESHVEVALTSLDAREMALAIRSLHARFDHTSALEVLGWYSSPHMADAAVSPTDAAVHHACFAEPWQTVLTFGDDRAGAFFLYDSRAAQWFHAPFHEVIDSAASAGTPKPTCVAWPAYLTTAIVVELADTPQVSVSATRAENGHADRTPRVSPLAIAKAVGARAVTTSRRAGESLSGIRARWAASIAQRNAEAEAAQERETARRAREAERRRVEREEAQRREAEVERQRAAEAEERRKVLEAEARARREAAEADARARREAAEAEARRQAAEAEARRQAEAAEAERRAAEEAERRAAEAEARRLAAEEAQRRAAEDARRRAEEADARRQAEEAEARRQAIEAEARRAAEEEARRLAAEAEAEARRAAREAEAQRLAAAAALEAERKAVEAEEDARRLAAMEEAEQQRRAAQAAEYARRRAEEAEALRISVQVAAFRNRIVGAPIEGSKRTQSRLPNVPLADVDDTSAADTPERYLTLAKREGFEVSQQVHRNGSETIWLLLEPDTGMRLIVVTTDTVVRDASLHYNLRVDGNSDGDREARTVYRSETCLQHLRGRCRRLRATGTLERDWTALPGEAAPADAPVAQRQALGADTGRHSEPGAREAGR